MNKFLGGAVMRADPASEKSVDGFAESRYRHREFPIRCWGNVMNQIAIGLLSLGVATAGIPLVDALPAGAVTIGPSCVGMTFTSPCVYTVPANASSLQLTVVGAGGGGTNFLTVNTPGHGARIVTNLDITPGTKLWMLPGGIGGTSSSNAGGTGGTNGGAQGGDGNYLSKGGGGGGGGYSGVFLAGAISQNTALVVAGGGGGAAYDLSGGNAGNSDGSGSDGGGRTGSLQNGQPGGGAGYSFPGTGGSSGAMGSGSAGLSGGDLLGGAGGSTTDGSSAGGGGGGGGFFGGGGGGPDHDGSPAGGGGGSSYILPGLIHSGTTPFVATATTVKAGSIRVQVNTVPVITSPGSVKFTVGTKQSFTFRATGTPAPYWLLTSGTLPTGITFKSNGDGTATLSGKAKASAAGQRIWLEITARNLTGEEPEAFLLKLK